MTSADDFDVTYSSVIIVIIAWLLC